MFSLDKQLVVKSGQASKRWGTYTVQRRKLLNGELVNPDLAMARIAAEDAATAAEHVIAEFLKRGDWSVSLKQDDSPVTEVDVAAENSIKNVLLKALPCAAFYGEETGTAAGIQPQAASRGIDTPAPEPTVSYRWLVDPIDGTKSFIRGMPFYSTQIALEVDGALCVGVSNAPAYGERLVAVTGHGVWLNGSEVRCSDVTELKDAFLSSGNLGTLAGHRADWERYAGLVTQVRRVRGYGDFCHYHQLCCGQTDLVVESDVNILDIAALHVAVHEAGGVMTDLAGAPVDEYTTSILAASTAELHQLALNQLGVESVNAAGKT